MSQVSKSSSDLSTRAAGGSMSFLDLESTIETRIARDSLGLSLEQLSHPHFKDPDTLCMKRPSTTSSEAVASHPFYEGSLRSTDPLNLLNSEL